jgi:superfamily II DNA or RNA helicase
VGLTATDERDDRLHYFEYDIFGPVVTENAGKETQPTVTFIETGTKAPMWIYSKPFNPGWKWNMCMTTIEKSQSRYDVIMKWLHKDLDAKRRIACISPQRRSIVQELAKRLRQEGYRVAYVDGDTKNRQKIYDDFNAGKYDILCAGKVLNALVDIQALNCIHLVSPIKKHAGTKQIYGRAREENAIIRDYADEGGQLTGAYKSRVKMCEGFGWKINYVKDDMVEASAEPMGGWVQRGKAKNAGTATPRSKLHKERPAKEPVPKRRAKKVLGNRRSSKVRRN